MKKTIILISKIVVLLLILVWMIFLVTDYFRARSGVKPIVCLNEKTIEKNNDSYYECVSFGYKYYEYKKNNITTYGFGASFLKNSSEKEIGE